MPEITIQERLDYVLAHRETLFKPLESGHIAELREKVDKHCKEHGTTWKELSALARPSIDKEFGMESIGLIADVIRKRFGGNDQLAGDVVELLGFEHVLEGYVEMLLINSYDAQPLTTTAGKQQMAMTSVGIKEMFAMLSDNDPSLGENAAKLKLAKFGNEVRRIAAELGGPGPVLQ